MKSARKILRQIFTIYIFYSYFLASCNQKEIDNTSTKSETTTNDIFAIDTFDAIDTPTEIDNDINTNNTDTINKDTIETDNDTSDTIFTNDTSNMVFVPAGKFLRGCNNDVDIECGSYPNESPGAQIDLDSFYIDRTEVTANAYAICINAGYCTALKSAGFCNWEIAEKGNHPMNCVTQSESEAYCTWAGKRLPTEAEWEKAARGTDGRTYPWGEEIASCNYAVMDDGGNGCGADSTMPVGSKPAGVSPYGALDMSGNVWEWTADWYDSSYYVSSPSRNPTGPNFGSERVKRGGSFYSLRESDLRASVRRNWFNSPDFETGFRCAIPVH